MENYISSFLAYLQGMKNASPHTVRSYGIDIREFFAREGGRVDKGAIRS